MSSSKAIWFRFGMLMFELNHRFRIRSRRRRLNEAAPRTEHASAAIT